MIKFRDLNADEIECRVATVNANGCSLLLYKDARCDMNILDETVGPENWQRRHTRDNANCIVGIWDDGKKQWVEKEDTGTESYTEKEKGQASDSFKRACFNWGIGRELYTAPFIWVSKDKCKIEQKNGKNTTYDRFAVSEIKIVNKRIVSLTIVNEKTGAVVCKWQKAASSGNRQNASGARKQAEPSAPELTEESKQALNAAIGSFKELTGLNINDVMRMLKEETGKSHKEYTEEDAKTALEILSERQEAYMESLGV